MLVCRNLIASVLVTACVLIAPSKAVAQAAFDSENEAENAYVEGNLLFLTYHEVGHLLIDSLLGVNQRDDRLSAEETADDIATWLLLPDPDEPEQDAEIVAAMLGWLDSADDQNDGDEGAAANPHYPDDAERAARIACYLYGSNPQRYGEIAHAFRNAIASVNCVDEHEALQDDIAEWFHEYVVPPAPANGGRISVSYEPAPPALAAARQYLVDARILELATQDINQFIRLPTNVKLTARVCGSGAAEFRYNAATREITACYEAVAWFMGDAPEEAATRAAQTSADDLGSGGARVKQRPRQRPR